MWLSKGRIQMMARKKSIKLAADRFAAQAGATVEFVRRVAGAATKDDLARVHDGAVIALYRDFENLMLDCLAGAINNDSEAVSEVLGFRFPKHMPAEACYFMVTGPSFFDFKGRSGLIARLKQYLPPDHFILGVVKARKYAIGLDRLCALRNFAAHRSWQSKERALEATGQAKMSSAGRWLMTGGRLDRLVGSQTVLAEELGEQAPY